MRTKCFTCSRAASRHRLRRQLLVGGFLNEVLERLPDAVLVAKLEALIAGNLRSARINAR